MTHNHRIYTMFNHTILIPSYFIHLSQPPKPSRQPTYTNRKWFHLLIFFNPRIRYQTQLKAVDQLARSPQARKRQLKISKLKFVCFDRLIGVKNAWVHAIRWQRWARIFSFRLVESCKKFGRRNFDPNFWKWGFLISVRPIGFKHFLASSGFQWLIHIFIPKLAQPKKHNKISIKKLTNTWLYKFILISKLIFIMPEDEKSPNPRKTKSYNKTSYIFPRRYKCERVNAIWLPISNEILSQTQLSISSYLLDRCSPNTFQFQHFCRSISPGKLSVKFPFLPIAMPVKIDPTIQQFSFQSLSNGSILFLLPNTIIFFSHREAAVRLIDKLVEAVWMIVCST